MNGPRPIVVAGAHRSGTTWVGKVIALASGIGYLHEPFSQMRRPGWTGDVFGRWYPYVSKDNEAEFVEPVEQVLRFQFPIRSQLRWIRSRRIAARTLRDFALSMLYRAGNRRLEEIGPEQAEAVRRTARSPVDVVDQGILLWNVIYGTVLRYASRFPHWQIIRLEDLGGDPVGGFKQVYARLNLPWDERVARFLRHHSNAKRRPSSPYSISRRSSEVAGIWKERLTAAEAERITSGVRDLAKHFYEDDPRPFHSGAARRGEIGNVSTRQGSS